MRRLAFGFALLLLATPVQAREEAPPPPPAPPPAGLEQRVNEQVPLDLPFHDEDGKDVKLGDYFHGKPVILVLAYFRCPQLCTLVLNGLVECLNKVEYTAGDQFEVVVVSFDPREGPELARLKKAAYLERYDRPGADRGWHFLTGKKESIDHLAEAVGFRYSYDAQKDQFAHASGLMVCTPQGRLYRYFFGLPSEEAGSKFSARDLRLALAEASGGKVGNVVDSLLLLCYHYDPATGKYSPAIENLVRAAAVLTVLLIAGCLVWAWRREARRSRQNLATAG
jgi:protein SCO1/2